MIDYNDYGNFIINLPEYTRILRNNLRLTMYQDINNDSIISAEDLALLESILQNQVESQVNITNEAAVSDFEPESVVEVENVEPLEPLIQENSKTLLINEFTSRFSDAVWFKKVQETSVLLAGVGGIGSYVAFLLSRLQLRRIIIYDPDIVESVNMSGQLYPLSSIGNSKATSIASIMRDFSDFHRTSVYNEYFTDRCSPAPIMICGFDNMEARKIFFYKWLVYVDNSLYPENCLFIDGRLAAEEFQILAIQGNDRRAIEEYSRKWLFSDEEAEATICSYKQTTFMANMIATYMVNIFVNFIANTSDEKPIIPRDIPFFISYNAETMFTKVEM